MVLTGCGLKRLCGIGRQLNHEYHRCDLGDFKAVDGDGCLC
jgi:hypothetical protein